MKRQKPPDPLTADGAAPATGVPSAPRATSQPRLVVSELALPDGRYELAYSRDRKRADA